MSGHQKAPPSPPVVTTPPVTVLKQPPKRTQTQGTQLLPLLIKSVNVGGLLLAVWVVGYYEFSVTWVLVPLFGYVAYTEYKKSKATKTARKLMADEPQAILARVDELPSWVYFPDVERAEWLNKMIQQMWPYIGNYVRNLLKTVVEPIVNTNLPAKLTPFKFQRIDLGSIPPRVGGVKVYIDNIRRDEIIMDVEITCASDADVTVTVRGLTAGIRDIMVHGTLRVVMSPLIDKVPIIGALSVFFISQPTIDFDLTDVANILDLPLLSTSLRTIVSDQIANHLVLPNKIPISLTDISDISELYNPPPEGVLRLYVIGAAELKRADVNLLGKGLSDPYCKIKVDEEHRKTSTKLKTITPEWNEIFEFVIEEKAGKTINFEVFDKDTTDDDFLGRAQLNVEDLAKTSTTETWVPLNDIKTGRLHIKAKWFYLSKDPDAFSPGHLSGELNLYHSTAILLVTVDSAKDLPSSKKAMIEPSPFVRLEVGNQKVQTPVKKRSTNPCWDRERGSSMFTFLVVDPYQQDLYVEVVDSSKDNSKLGIRKIPISQLLSLDDLTVCRPFSLRDCVNQASITLRLCLRVLTSEKPVEDTGDQEDPDEDSPDPATSTPQRSHEVSPNRAERGDHDNGAFGAQPIGSRESSVSRGYNEGGPAGNVHPGLRYRGPVGLKSDGRFGRIQLTIRYAQMERLVVVIHKCTNLIPCDNDNLADPYVRIYLLPEKSKKKTQTQKNNLSPIFDETFDWHVKKEDLLKRTLDIAVKNSVSVFSKNRVNMGLLQLNLSDFDNLSTAITDWFDLSDPDAVQKASNPSLHHA